MKNTETQTNMNVQVKKLLMDEGEMPAEVAAKLAEMVEVMGNLKFDLSLAGHTPSSIQNAVEVVYDTFLSSNADVYKEISKLVDDKKRAKKIFDAISKAVVEHTDRALRLVGEMEKFDKTIFPNAPFTSTIQ